MNWTSHLFLPLNFDFMQALKALAFFPLHDLAALANLFSWEYIEAIYAASPADHMKNA